MANGKTRHILSLSGGKDSTALAIYMRDRVPEMEYVFCDTEKELPETYEYLYRLEAYLGQPIVRLKHDGRGFDHWLVVKRGYLPSPRQRWCTEQLKIRPYEEYIGDDNVYSYIGIRADESRLGYISRKPNITPVYPFKDDGIGKADVYRILDASGLGVPHYYRWRSRSGCYFCFFQQQIEWVGLLENHPDLFRQAAAYERLDGDISYTWNQGESLEELARPDRVCEIKSEHKDLMTLVEARLRNRPLIDVFADTIEIFQSELGCTICEV